MGCFGTFLILALIVGTIQLLISALPFIGAFILVFLFIFAIWKIRPIKRYKKYKFKKFEKKYYKSEEFLNTKKRVEKYIKNCNELNAHISELKNVHLGINQIDYGTSNYYDTSIYKYERPEYKKHTYKQNVYNCSRTICDNARIQPFKYICKYFDIKITEETLQEFEELLNNFEAARDGIDLLEKEKDRILNSIENEVPEKIRKYGYERFQYEIGFRVIGFDEMVFPKYIFQYVSPGGNASTECDVVMDIENLNLFVKYLSEKIKFNKSVAGQRALMTSSLRRKILNRDNYTCQKCQNSIRNEPNLLLEIDHIFPLSKGGMTTEDNLQTLCWRCNRHKASKIL